MLNLYIMNAFKIRTLKSLVFLTPRMINYCYESHNYALVYFDIKTVVSLIC